MRKTYFEEPINNTNEMIDTPVIDETNENEAAPAKVRKAAGKAKTGRVKSRHVFVRARAAANAEVLITLKFGDEVKIRDRVDGFYKVEVQASAKRGPIIGYVASTFLEEV